MPWARASKVDRTRGVSRGGTRSEHLGGDEEKRRVRNAVSLDVKTYIGRTRASSLDVSGSFGSEDLQTAVKTNLPTLRAIGKLIVILPLTLLHFCVGSQVSFPPAACILSAVE